MSLQEQQFSVKFAGGIETKMDSKSVPAVRLLALENGVFTKAISIRKRNGYRALSQVIDNSVSTITGARHLARRDDELLLFTDNRCYSKQSGNDQWTDAGAVVSAVPRERSVMRTGTEQTAPDYAVNGGVAVYAWEDSRGGVWYAVADASTDRVFRAPAQADASGERPRCVAVGEALHIYYAVPTQRRVMVIVINPATPGAAVNASILIDDLDSTSPDYDACPTLRDNQPAAIVWREHATTNFRVGYVDQGGALGSPASDYPSVHRYAASLSGTSPLAVAHLINGGGPDDDLLVIAYVDTTLDARAVFFNGGTGPSGGSVAISLAAGPMSWTDTPTTNVQRIAAAWTQDETSYVWLVAEEAAAVESERYCIVGTAAPSGASGQVGVFRSVGLASRAFTDRTLTVSETAEDAGTLAGDVFAHFVHDTTYFNTYLTLRLSDGLCIGRFAAGGATGAPPRSHLPSVHVSDRVATVCLPMKTRLESENNDQFGEAGLQLMSLDFDDPDSHRYAQLGAGLYLAGGCPMHYDGYRWTEAGFHVGPERVLGTPAAGGSMTASATYGYKAWYEYTDAAGEIHRGPESVALLVTMGGADTQVTLTLPTLRVTQKQNVRVCVARSLANDQTRYFRVTSLDPTTSGAVANGYVANSTSTDSVSFVDRLSDADLQEQEPLYTNAGVFSNDPTTLGGIVAGGKNRLFFTDALDPHMIRFSQGLLAGYGVDLAPELFLPCDPFGGDITALAVMDDKVVVFKEHAIYTFNGDGPPPNGNTAGTGFSAPVLVTSDVGCNAPGSIVLVPDGLMFKSDKGIYLLNRSLAVSYEGAPAESYNEQDVTAAAVMPDRSQVVFLTSSGKALLFDFLFRQWSTFTNHEGYSAIVVDDSFHYLRTDGRVFQETVGEYSDAGVRITLRLETAWLHIYEHLQGLQRFWKLLLLGTWVSPHQLGIQYRTDYESSWADPQWLDATGESDSTGWITGNGANTIGVDPITGSNYGDGNYGDGAYGGTDPDVYQWRVGLHCAGQSIQFRFEDFEKSGLAGASFELTEMTLVVGVDKPDVRPFTAARSA